MIILIIHDNISKDIFNFIDEYHKKYSIKIDINNLIENIENEVKRIVEISKNFIDILFIDGDEYLNNLNNDNQNLEENLLNESNVEIDNYWKEDNNLINKLNNLNVNDDEIENNDIFEEKETLNEYDSIY